MKRKNTTRNALFTSILSLLLCVSMLVGTTFAWFTDSVISGTNVIAAGNLDVELYHADKDDADYVKATTELFNDITLWEPGVVVYENFTVENKGNLALKYELSINFSNATDNGKGGTLADVLKVAVVEGGFNGDRAAAQKLNYNATLESFTLTGELEGDEKSNVYGIVVYWEPSDMDNDYNMNNGRTEVLSIDLGVNLFATQEMYEEDSFDETYDYDATYTAEVATLSEKLAAAKSGDVITFNLSHDAYVTESITVPNGTKLILNGNGHTIISNTKNVFVAKNAAVEISDVTIIGKAQYAIFTQGARWLAENPSVGVVLTNVTVDLDQATNFPITFNGMGDVVMKDCTVKGAGLPSGDYADGLHVFAGAEINLTVDGGNIGGIMLNANYGSSATMTAKNGAVIDKVDIECATAADGSLVAAPVTNDGATINDTVYAVYDAKQLKAALANGSNVVLADNITTTDKVTVKTGAYLDGNGKTIDFDGSFNGYEKAVNLEAGATVKNLNVANAGRAYGSDGNTGDIYLDNISGTNAHYFFNGDTTTNSNVYITNSTLDGWISYGGANLFSFDNCVLKGETSRFYGICYFVTYSDAEFKNCTFDNFYMAMNTGAYNDGAAGSTIKIDNCVYVTENGTVKVTAENFTSLFMGDGDETDFNRMLENSTIVIDGYAVAFTADDLSEALVNGGNVVLTENMTATAPLQVNGGTLNGNGNTLDFTGVKTSSWPSAYAVTLNNGGSKVENLTITNAGYAIGSTAATEDIYIDNVTTDYVTYAINGNGNNTNSVYVTNSHINGWISYSNIKLLSFDNCTLGKGNTGYAYLVVYGDTTFTGCTFESPFAMCARYQDGAVVAAGKTVTFTNCTYVQADGTSVKVTAENFASLFGKADDDDFQYMKQVNVVIDGVAVSWN